MPFELRGSDLSASENWDDYVDVLQHQLTYRLDVLEDIDEYDLFARFTEEDLDASKAFLIYLSQHDNPQIRDYAGMLAFDMLPHDEELATGIITETFEKMADSPQPETSRMKSYARDVLTSGDLALEQVSLSNLAKIIRGYKSIADNPTIE